MATVRAMTLDDLKEVYEIELVSFRIPWTLEAYEKEVAENDLAHYFVAEEKGKILGFIGMWHILDEGHITNCAVAEDCRRMGIGNLLMLHTLDFARSRGISAVTLEVNINNLKAQKLYTKNGFIMEGIRKNYYAETKEDALIMWKRF